MKRLFMILVILVMAFFCGACGAKKEQQAVTEGSESESVTESEESREETSSRADDAEAIPGYYRMVELRRGDEIAADRAYIEEELEPEYGLYYLEIAEDGNAVLQVAGVKLSLTSDFEEKVLRAGAEIGTQYVYAFSVEPDQILLESTKENVKSVSVFERAEKPEETSTEAPEHEAEEFLGKYVLEGHEKEIKGEVREENGVLFLDMTYQGEHKYYSIDTGKMLAYVYDPEAQKSEESPAFQVSLAENQMIFAGLNGIRLVFVRR
ncbi:MAG: hypothetical protein IJU99_05445 [Lachnospiraceae bacterium]|nr:hypothetical protein [Lachnospiraceae bacterium]